MRKIMKYKLKLDYTKEELEELKLLGKVCDSPMTAVWQVAETEDRSGIFRKLQARYMTIGNEDELDFMTDINNAVMGNAVFPEKKYIVHDKVTDRYIYFNRLEKSFYWGQLKSWIPEIKTKEEWLEINPAYEPMLERVEDDE